MVRLAMITQAGACSVFGLKYDQETLRDGGRNDGLLDRKSARIGRKERVFGKKQCDAFVCRDFLDPEVLDDGLDDEIARADAIEVVSRISA